MNKIDQIFRLEFLLVDDDPTLNGLVRASLGTRKLRRLCERVIREYWDEKTDITSQIHYADNAKEARKIWAGLKRDLMKPSPSMSSQLVGYCVIAFIDFDMPGENGLELATSLKEEPVEVILFTGRQPQMQTFMSEQKKDLEDFGVGLLMLKGAPAQEFNDGIITLLKKHLKEVTGS